MEGDAGAGRLNPIDADETSPAREAGADENVTEVGADESGTQVTAEDPTGSGVGPDGSAPSMTAQDSQEAEPEPDGPAVERRASRLQRGWLVGIAAALVLAAAAIGAGGFLALRSHDESQAIARDDATALKAAVDCVTATQAPDTNAMAASERKIIECGADAYRSQALLYTGMLVQAYQAANVHVQVSDVRAAVERNNSDGSVDVLVALRVKVASDQSQNEAGYRLRVKMARSEGVYKISKLDQVTK